MATGTATHETTTQEIVGQQPVEQPAVKKAVAKKSPAKKAARKKSNARKTAANNKPSTKTAAAKKSAAKKVAKKRATKKRVAKKPPAKRLTAKKSAAKKPATISKAQAIRDAFKELGKKTRPRDIIAALAAKGISVSHALVGSTLKAAGLRKGRRRRKAPAAVTRASANGRIHALNLDHLLQVKELAEQLGGTTRLKELVVALERLM